MGQMALLHGNNLLLNEGQWKHITHLSIIITITIKTIIIAWKSLHIQKYWNNYICILKSNFKQFLHRKCEIIDLELYVTIGECLLFVSPFHKIQRDKWEVWREDSSSKGESQGGDNYLYSCCIKTFFLLGFSLQKLGPELGGSEAKRKKQNRDLRNW